MRAVGKRFTQHPEVAVSLDVIALASIVTGDQHHRIVGQRTCRIIHPDQLQRSHSVSGSIKRRLMLIEEVWNEDRSLVQFWRFFSRKFSLEFIVIDLLNLTQFGNFGEVQPDAANLEQSL